MRTVDEILSLYRERSKYYMGLHGKMRTIQSIYNGTMSIPLPEIERSEMPSVPNLLAQGVDQMAGRVASVIPNVTFATTSDSRAEARRAMTAGRVTTGWWQLDRIPMKMKQRARHIIAYAEAPCVIRWDAKVNRPIWHVRHPLETFPSTDITPGQCSPTDVIFAYRRSINWLKSMGYGLQVGAVTGRWESNADTEMLLLEYIDAESTILILTAQSRSDEGFYGYDQDFNSKGSMKGVVLESIPNPIGIMPATVPMRITLDGPTGQFDNMIGMYYQQAKLMALETIAVEKGIFPDTYLISRAGEVGRFLDGPHDGRTGMVNIISGGDIREIQSQPGYLTNPTIDRLERNQRVTAGIPAEFGGESGSNIRTGRRGDAVLSAVIDFPVSEAQETFGFALEKENEIAIALAKKYDGSATRTIYVGVGNTSRSITYEANKVFTNSEHVVSYPAAGTDLNSLMIGLGQRVGLGTMSKETAASLDPFIDNPEQEHDRIIAEGLEQALVSGIQQQAASGSIPPITLAKIMRLVQNDRMELAEALDKVTKDAMAEQEKKQSQIGGMEEEMSPDAMAAGPSLQALAGGPPQPSSPIPGESQGQQDLMSLLSTLKRPTSSMGGV